jgi:hypothetical protein
MTRTVLITITDTPKETAAIALAMRRYILRTTAAFVWDNCGPGTQQEPRKLEASFPEKWKPKTG